MTDPFRTRNCPRVGLSLRSGCNSERQPQYPLLQVVAEEDVHQVLHRSCDLASCCLCSSIDQDPGRRERLAMRQHRRAVATGYKHTRQ